GRRAACRPVPRWLSNGVHRHDRPRDRCRRRTAVVPGVVRSRPSLVDLPERIEDAFGLFGPPERCADRLIRAREEAGVEHVFLFPAHTLAGGYDMPEDEIEMFRRVIRPRLA